MQKWIRRAGRVKQLALQRLLKSLDERMIRLYGQEQAEAGLKRLYSQRSRVALLLDGSQFDLYRMQGIEPNQQRRLTLLFACPAGAGASRPLEHIQQLVFGGNPVQQQKLGSCPDDQLKEMIDRQSTGKDLVVVERNNRLSWLPERGSWVLTPTWVRMVFKLAAGETIEQARRRMRRHRQNLRRMEKAGLGMRVSHAEEDFELFYQRMYVPMVRNRHDAAGRVGSKEYLHGIFKKGLLFLITGPDGQDVAGALCFRSGDVLFGVTNGMLDGQETSLEMGAMSAIYYHSIKWCAENGVHRLDVASCHPFANDGLYLHKKRWDMEPVTDWWESRDWLFWVPDSSEAGLRWLEEHPLLPQYATYGGNPIRLEEAEEDLTPVS